MSKSTEPKDMGVAMLKGAALGAKTGMALGGPPGAAVGAGVGAVVEQIQFAMKNSDWKDFGSDPSQYS